MKCDFCVYIISFSTKVDSNSSLICKHTHAHTHTLPSTGYNTQCRRSLLVYWLLLVNTYCTVYPTCSKSCMYTNIFKGITFMIRDHVNMT